MKVGCPVASLENLWYLLSSANSNQRLSEVGI
jgi:hypothetical protein